MSNTRIKIPVVIGKNRMRGNSQGAMVDDEPGEDNLIDLRNALRKDAVAAGVEPTAEWLMTAVRQLLRMYEDSHARWLAAKNDTIGHVFEAALPSGQELLFGCRRTLARIS